MHITILNHQFHVAHYQVLALFITSILTPHAELRPFLQNKIFLITLSSLYVGQRVFVTGKNSGAYAEYIVSDSAFVFPLDERLSFAQGAALGTPYFTAYKALIMGAQMKPGEMVLVHGVSPYDSSNEAPSDVNKALDGSTYPG